MRWPSCPELIAAVETIDKDGDTIAHGDKIISVSVSQDKDNMGGEVCIDIRKFAKQGDNLLIRIPYIEFQAALASATLNSERNP